jgi:hypothetical protein
MRISRVWCTKWLIFNAVLQRTLVALHLFVEQSSSAFGCTSRFSNSKKRGFNNRLRRLRVLPRYQADDDYCMGVLTAWIFLVQIAEVRQQTKICRKRSWLSLQPPNIFVALHTLWNRISKETYQTVQLLVQLVTPLLFQSALRIPILLQAPNRNHRSARV